MKPETGLPRRGQPTRQVGPGLPALPCSPPGCQMLGCRNCGQLSLPNTTSCVTESLGAQLGWGSPLPRLVSGPQVSQASSAPHPRLVTLRSGAAWLLAAVVCFSLCTRRSESASLPPREK